jgi:cyanate lyase
LAAGPGGADDGRMSVIPLPPLDRMQAAAAVLAAKKRAGVRWADLGKAIGRSTEWTTAAVLGQHPLTDEQAATLGAALELDEAVVDALTLPPVRGKDVVDTSEPLVYRLQEMVQVYGSTIHELVREEFGDGIVSAIDFELDVERVPDPKGDRVRITLNGKFLPYRTW